MFSCNLQKKKCFTLRKLFPVNFDGVSYFFQRLLPRFSWNFHKKVSDSIKHVLFTFLLCTYLYERLNFTFFKLKKISVLATVYVLNSVIFIKSSIKYVLYNVFGSNSQVY